MGLTCDLDINNYEWIFDEISTLMKGCLYISYVWDSLYDFEILYIVSQITGHYSY